MSTIVMSACWPLQGMTPAQKSVLISLADNANDHGVCWPAVETIATRCCMSPRTVQRALDWLHERGAISLLRKTGRSTTYTVTPEKYTPDAKSPPSESHPRRKVTPVRKSGGGVTVTPPPPSESHQPPSESHPNRKEPSFEPSLNLSSPPSSAARGTRLPKDWVLTKKLALWALQEQKTWDGEHVRKVADGFRDYWHAKPGKDGRKVDWDATWRNWVRNAAPLGGGSRAVDEAPSEWWLSDSGIGAQGKRVRVERTGPNESTPDYLIRVAKASGRGPWIDYVLKREQGSSRYPQVIEFFGDALLPPDF